MRLTSGRMLPLPEGDVHVGIDFGTTRSVVAACDRGNYPVVSFVNDDDDTADWYPSLVVERRGELLCGWSAMARMGDPDWTVLRSFKRLLTDSKVRPDQRVRVGELELSLSELLQRFFTSLHEDLKHRSNMPEELRRLDRIPAFVATPANAHGTQRFLTIDAFRKAGFDVVALLNEPSAAGFEYAHRHRGTFTSRREHVVVYDLGGGTFDASLVRMTGQHHDVVYTAGVPRLGGDDFDAVLVDLVLSQLGLTDLPPEGRLWAALADRCRDAKEALGTNSRRVLVDVESALGEGSVATEVALPVSAFYEACAPLIEHTVQAMEPLFAREELLDGGAGNLPGVAGIYVVGGASALPVVGRTLRHRYGRRVHRSPYPSAATAIGLAIAGDPDAGYRLTDRFSRAFGVFRELREGAAVSFDPIFTKDTRMPTPEQGRVTSTRSYRAAHNIGHFRYVECESVDPSGGPAGDITPFAEVVFPFDPSLCEAGVEIDHAPVQRMASPGPLVEEQYSIDPHGMVEVRIRNLDAGYERVFRLWG